MDSWGVELLANFADCERIIEKEHVENFARELVQAIDMVAYGEPVVVNFGKGNKEGFTLVQLIETSNIVAHFCNSTKEVYLNVFSCKDFDPTVAIEVFNKYFNSKKFNYKVEERQAPHL